MMTFPKNLFEILSDASKAYGYSIAETARQVIERGVAAGLLHRDTPTSEGIAVIRNAQFDEYCAATQELNRLHEAEMTTLRGHLKLRTELIAKMTQRLEESSELIAEQARELLRGTATRHKPMVQ